MAALFSAFVLSTLIDPLIGRFLGRVLGASRKIRHLTMTRFHPINLILSNLGSNLKHVSSIVVKDQMIRTPHLASSDEELRASLLPSLPIIDLNGELNITLVGGACTSAIFMKILGQCRISGIIPSLCLVTTLAFPYPIEISQFLKEDLKQLFVMDTRDLIITFQGNIPECPKLTQLHLVNTFHHSVFSGISKAVKQKKFPKLTYLSFECRRFHPRPRRMSIFFQSPWPTLRELDLSGYLLKSPEVLSLTNASEKTFLPNLETLFVSASCEISVCTTLLRNPWPNLRRLFVDKISKEREQELMAIVRKGHFLNLTELTLLLTDFRSSIISMKTISQFLPKLLSLNLHGFSALKQITFHWKLCKIDFSHTTFSIEKLLSNSLPSLQSLFLSNCDLNCNDLGSLAKYSSQGRVPELRHLDLSMNPKCGGNLESLFDANCAWKGLLSLHIQQACVSEESEKWLLQRDSETIIRHVGKGCLRLLQELSLTVYTPNYFREKSLVFWGELKQLNMLVSMPDPFAEENIHFSCGPLTDNADHPVLQPLHSMVSRSLFPALETIYVVIPTRTPRAVILAADKYFFSKHGIGLNVSGSPHSWDEDEFTSQIIDNLS